MKSRRCSIAAATLIVASMSGATFGQWTYTLVDRPGTSYTQFTGISDNQIIGESSLGAFIYDGTNWTALQAPGATGGTSPTGISGNRVVGTYWTSGGDPNGYSFLYDAGSWTTLQLPGAPQGIDGDLIVGSSSQNRQGYVYDLATGSTRYVMAPAGVNPRGTGVWSTTITDISNGVLTGWFYDNLTDPYPFSCDGTSWRTVPAWGYAYSISGGRVVGVDGSIHPSTSWMWDGVALTIISVPGEGVSLATGIEGNHIVGCCATSTLPLDLPHGFVATYVPEPATAFLAVTALGLFRWSRQRAA